MTFGSPQFLFLLPLLFLAGWVFRSLELWRPLRVVLLLLITLLLCDPRIVLKSGGIDLWVLLDRSRSAQSLVESGEQEWRTLLERSRPDQTNEIHFLDYAAEVVPAGTGETALYSGSRELTRTGLAVHDALARMDSERHNRLLLFTDGYSTEPLTGVAAKLIAQGVPLDYRILRAPDAPDYLLTGAEMPERALPGEPFVVDVMISGTVDGVVPLEVFKGENRLLTKEIAIKGGLGRLRFSDRITEPGSHQYRLAINPAQDAHPGNNRFERWIEIASGPRILLLTKYQNDPLAAILRAQRFEVTVIENLLDLSPGVLTGAKAVILNNVPAFELPNDFLNALPFFVNEQGGGLLMAGGRHSFGSGGYYESAIDPLLPVSMELKSEHRKLGVAMAIVMDRSGSMAMTTSSGHTKMQLANEGAARSVELLGTMDAVTVFAVDSQAHQIAPLMNVGESRGELNSRIRRIESMGGGIFVYEGLKAAWNELKKAPLGQRHVILFTDAADSEEPGEYRRLIDEMKAGGTTISVIGVGARSDADAALLEDIATRGGGRIFFSENAGEIPNIFAQETVTVARSSFVEDLTGSQATGRWYEIARKEVEWLKEVDGYNLSYLREGDETALVSTDTYAAPLVAFGRRGIGRTAAVAFPLGGEFSERSRNWTHLGDFIQTLTRWLMGDELPPGIGIRHDLTGSELSIELLYDSGTWEEKISTTPPTVVIEKGFRNGKKEELIWERLSPGHYQVTTRLEEGTPARGAVQVAGAAIPFGPITVGSGSEWRFDPERVKELRETARASGGEELLDLSKAWKKPPAPGEAPIRIPLLFALLILFLFEALVTRTGWQFPGVSYQTLIAKLSATMAGRSKIGRTRSTNSSPREERKESLPQADPKTPASPEPPSHESRKSRFNRAKKGL